MYYDRAQDVVMTENLLLQTLGFDVAITHPHTYVVKCCQLVRGKWWTANISCYHWWTRRLSPFNRDKKTISILTNCRDGGGVSLFIYLFICWSSRLESSCFATPLLHHAPPKVTSVLVLFFVFESLFLFNV